MYEGQPLICKEIIEENWLEYLAFVKKQSDDELERQKKRMEALKEIDGAEPAYGLAEKAVNTVSDYPSNRYYDISVHSFWNWYVTNKVEVK